MLEMVEKQIEVGDKDASGAMRSSFENGGSLQESVAASPLDAGFQSNYVHEIFPLVAMYSRGKFFCKL